MSQPDDRAAAAFFPAAVVWDLDGTLVDSAADLATALNALLVEHGQHTHAVDRVRPMIGAGVAKLIERGFRAAGSPLDAAGLERLLPRFMTLYRACATDQTRLIEGARTVLEHFYHTGVPQGLCTNKPAGVTRQILQALDIAGFFGCVVGGDTTAARKPDPLPLRTCLAELGVEPERALMIGDSGADVGAARAAGVPVALVPDGYTGVPAESLDADWVVESLAGVPDLFPPPRPLRHSA
jgi:phosphoglycolate phosphatase